MASPYAAKPSALGKPVPGASEEQMVNDFLADFKAPAAPAQQPQAEIDPADAFLADFNVAPADAQMVPEEIPVDEIPTVETESPMQRYERTGSLKQTAKEVFGDTAARFQAAWGVTEKEKVGKLKEIYGSDGVRTKDGEIQIKRPGEKGFRSFDPDSGMFSLDIINDVVDFSRDAAEGSTVLAQRAALAKAGKSGGGAKGGAIDGLKAGAAAGADAVIGLQVGDYIAEKLIGIQRDPERDGLKEAAIVGGIGAGIGSAFGVASGALARKRIANEARKSSVTSQEVLKIAKEVEEASESLSRNGINLKQGKMTLSPGQITKDLVPEAETLDFNLSDESKVRDFYVEQGKLVQSGWDKLKQGISNIVGKPEEELFTSVKGAAKAAREAEGKLIGAYRDEAIKVSSGKSRPMPKTSEKLPELFQNFGFSMDQGKLQLANNKIKLVKPTLEKLQESFPDATPTVLGRAQSVIADLSTTLNKNNGSLPLAETDRLYSEMRKVIDDFWGTKSGGDVARKLVNVKNALRDDWTQAIGAELVTKRPGAVEGYKTAMQKYSDILSAQDTLKNVLKKDDLSASAFANQIFSPAQGKDRVRQIKTLIEDSDPQLWNQLVDKQLELIQKGAVDPKTDRTNWLKLSGQINQLEKSEVLDQMMTPEAKANLKNFIKIAEKVDSSFDFKENSQVPTGVVNSVKALLIMGANSVSNLARLAAGGKITTDLIGAIGKDKALVKWLNGEGLEIALRGVPPKQQGKIRQWANTALKGAVLTGYAGERRDQAVERGMREAPQE